MAYPTLERNNRKELKAHPGFFSICIHKGSHPRGHAGAGRPGRPAQGGARLARAQLHHLPRLLRAAFFGAEALESIRTEKLRNGVPDLRWLTEFAQISAPLRNVYAEIGTTFASCVITFPSVCAHMLGQLLKYMGPERIVFGSDSLWYGAPQWQIEAFWRFQIPQDMAKKYGYPALNEKVKRQILGLNSARLYNLPNRVAAYKPVPSDYERRIRQPQGHAELPRLLEAGLGSRRPARADAAERPARRAAAGLRSRRWTSG